MIGLVIGTVRGAYARVKAKALQFSFEIGLVFNAALACLVFLTYAEAQDAANSADDAQQSAESAMYAAQETSEKCESR